MSATLLIIDDSPSDVRTLVELLRDQPGFRILVALSGADGFDKAVTTQPDLILLDRIMPEMDGLNTCRLLKSDPRTTDIPVIFLTAMQALEDKVEGFSLGSCDYITKPWQAQEVLARLRVHVDLHKRLRTLPVQTPDEPPDYKKMSRAELRVHKAQVLYLQDMSITLTLTDIARKIGTHARQLAEDFRQVTGQSAQNWLREQRMKQACELLLTTDLEIGRIAEQNGYSSAAAFSNAFREYFNMSPSDYRRASGLPMNRRDG